MKNLLKWLIIVVVTVILVAMLSITGCKEPSVVTETVIETVTETVEVEVEKEEETGPVTIRFTSWAAAAENTNIILDQIIAEFEKENPDIKVESVGIPYGEIVSQTIISIAGGNPADVIELTPFMSVQVANIEGALLDLTPIFLLKKLLICRKLFITIASLVKKCLQLDGM